MKQKHWNIIIGAVAIIALVVSLPNGITPLKITNDTHIGIIATFIGISVALLIGHQIVNSLEINKKIKSQEEKMSEIYSLQKQRFDILDTKYEEKIGSLSGEITCFNAHAALEQKTIF